MYNLFSFAIGVRLVAFIVFVVCVYAGNLLFAKMERRQSKLLWKISFVTLYSLFLLLLTYVVWFVFYFGLNA
ncbi:conserved domain protein [Streptococcus mitis SK569]|nr:conserved domain protein [Streptococcus mitis SK569]